MKDRFQLEDESSLLNWYPKVKDLLMSPKTEILGFTREERICFFDALAGKPLPEGIIERIYQSADKIGYPLFLRSDQGSGKHEWRDTCYVPDRESLIYHVIRLIEWHECAGIMGLQWEALVFRELLSLESLFTAFHGMPVSRERRVFVRDGVVECIHPYWPEDAVLPDRNNPLPENWKECLIYLNYMSGEEIGQISFMAGIFGKALPGYWSVDFACGEDGLWWLIDAARGELSWHPSDCKYCPDEQKPKEGGLCSILVELAEEEVSQNGNSPTKEDD